EGTYIMNAKYLNLSSHVDTKLKSCVIDSLKIEGRTKSTYYVGITTKTYRKAIDDYYEQKFDANKYEKELSSTKNRGFNDGYLVKRPFEKHNTQNLENSISEGTHQVCAMVCEDGLGCLSKDKLEVNIVYELVLPECVLQECKNEFGKIFLKDGVWYIEFEKLQSRKGKIYESIHSGNTNAIILPIALPAFTFLRRKI
ncbi:MAG: U32 family peptidase, partial [Campylobacteraceae bacterium]|nr:U32 family peptidase [Campylobacteraceae bacterium]